jgi:hypothetical protein
MYSRKSSSIYLQRTFIPKLSHCTPLVTILAPLVVLLVELLLTISEILSRRDSADSPLAS